MAVEICESSFPSRSASASFEALRMTVPVRTCSVKLLLVLIWLCFFCAAMHQAWPRLMKRIEAGKATDSSEDRKLITASRVWFCLYLFEHQ